MVDETKTPPGVAKSARGRLASLYRRIGRTYLDWARTLLPLAIVVFVPLGLIHAIPVHVEATDLDLDSGLEVFAAGLAVLLLGFTALLGEIFYTGAVAIALTRRDEGSPLSLGGIARAIDYRALIVVDVVFAVAVAVGLTALVVPGIVLFIYLGLAAPLVEIEHVGVRAGLVRSVRLVRGRFWFVLAALLPIELASSAVAGVATHLADSFFGDSFVASWLTDAASNILLTPFYAVAAVLLTLRLIDEEDGGAPPLHSAPGRL